MCLGYAKKTTVLTMAYAEMTTVLILAYAITPITRGVANRPRFEFDQVRLFRTFSRKFDEPCIEVRLVRACATGWPVGFGLDGDGSGINKGQR